MFLRSSSTLVLVLAAAWTAHAQPGHALPGPADAGATETVSPEASRPMPGIAISPSSDREAGSQQSRRDRKSEAAALTLAIATPLTSIAAGAAMLEWNAGPGWFFIIAGLSVGPSAGHIYTGEFGKAALFSLGQTVTAGAAGLFAAVYGLQYLCATTCSSRRSATPLVLAGAAGAGWLALTVWDISDSPASARRVNDERASKLTLLPLLHEAPAPDARRQVFAGLQLAGAY